LPSLPLRTTLTPALSLKGEGLKERVPRLHAPSPLWGEGRVRGHEGEGAIKKRSSAMFHARLFCIRVKSPFLEVFGEKIESAGRNTVFGL